jgi:phage-related protein
MAITVSNSMRVKAGSFDLRLMAVGGSRNIFLNKEEDARGGEAWWRGEKYTITYHALNE